MVLLGDWIVVMMVVVVVVVVVLMMMLMVVVDWVMVVVVGVVAMMLMVVLPSRGAWSVRAGEGWGWEGWGRGGDGRGGEGGEPVEWRGSQGSEGGRRGKEGYFDRIPPQTPARVRREKTQEELIFRQRKALQGENEQRTGGMPSPRR